MGAIKTWRLAAEGGGQVVQNEGVQRVQRTEEVVVPPSFACLTGTPKALMPSASQGLGLTSEAPSSAQRIQRPEKQWN